MRSSSTPPIPRLLRWLRLGANHVLVLMMATMFVSFILQIGFRYISNKPLAWTDEVCVLMWLWGILWGASFVMSNRDDIRFDVLTSHVSRGVRRVLTVIVSAAIVAILLLSLPASWSYISFMKVEDSASLGIRMDFFFSIYIAFVVAMVVRHAHLGIEALRDRLFDDEPAMATAMEPARDAA
jgi:TRAP-type C4-dicarboxylate transport system permease small subunit